MDGVWCGSCSDSGERTGTVRLTRD